MEKPFFSEGSEEVTASYGAGAVGPGSQIGPFKLLGVLGEGGYGIVYLAAQEQPIRRRVALKVIKPGMDSRQVIARFEAERQALALLDHPNIAQIHDAGTTPEGRPYFAMEYIEGLPITEYCDRQTFAIRERLQLFLQVCSAVQHAHQKGIIHRDLKPSNILVTGKDGESRIRIIDFGIAKALAQTLTEKTLCTEQGQLLGTPDYMSPEQAEMNAHGMDTRSDVYSLGVVLYELLTGVLPFDPDALRAGGVEHIRAVLRDEEPCTPSMRLTGQGAELPRIARQRQTNPQTLIRSLQRELECIPLQAMRKESARRYQSVSELADDIENYLKGAPLLAGPESVAYRTRKFVQRHRLQAAIAGSVFLVAILSVGVIEQHRRGQDNLHAMQAQLEARQKVIAKADAQSALSTAQAHYASGRYAEALKALGALVDNEQVGSQARLLRARMALDQPEVDVPVLDELQALLQEPNEIAAQAHLLLARIYLDCRADDDGTARELERKATEHLQKAEHLPDSADGCFGHALLSDAPAERMELLNKALALDPGHVNSRRIRALAFYASRDYDNMEIDASVITAVAKDNPEGYALRAIALREKAQLSGREELLRRAAVEHAKAIDLAPTQARFRDDRRETYMRLGEYEKALADAQECLRFAPGEGIYHFHVFCALTALGRYAEAQREYETMVIQDGSYQFRRWAAVYALDLVDRRASWHPTGPQPEGAAFTIIRQTVEAHQNLAKKARCVVREGAIATWSPAGDELVYARGPLGYSAIEVLNLKTGATRLLCYSGVSPAWSPDGRWIAFARHRRTVRLQDLTEGTHAYEPARADQEIWIVNADGSGPPRRLARGGFPSWSRDSKRVYYHSPEDGGCLYSISLEGNQAKPVRVMRALYLFPVVAPDEKYVVWHIESPDWAPAELAELPGGKVVARWIGFFPNWSSDGKSLVFSRCDGRNDGVWVCDLEKGKAVRVLDDWICYRCSWALSTGQIALSAYAHATPAGDWVYSGVWGSIWVSSLDRNVLEGGSSVPVEHWPRDESDPRSLMQMLRGYKGIPERATELEQLYRKLIGLLKQAVASSDPDSVQPVRQLADVYLWFGRYDDAEQLFQHARDTQRARYGPRAESLGDLTEDLVRFYLDVLNDCGRAEQLCLELLRVRQEAFRAGDARTIRTLILLARIYEHRKRYREAEQLYLEILKIQPVRDAEGNAPAAYTGVVARWAFAPLSYFLDETAFVLKLLEDRSAGVAREDRGLMCAHYLLARLYATCPEAGLRKVAQAIEHGTSACELSGWEEPICLDALAAAYAAAGRLDVALQRQKEAILRLSGDKAVMRTAFVNRLAMYERGVAEPFQGLVARWEFESSREGMVPDLCGNDLHGQLIGDAKIYADPDRGNVLCLDGAGDWVDCGTDPRFDITAEITISAWIKVTKFDKDWQTILAKGVAATPLWGLLRAGTTDTLGLSWEGFRETGSDLYGTLGAHTNVNDGKWHHVTGVYDGRRVSLYIDGKEDAALPILAFTRIRASAGPLLIGAGAGSPREWNGLIDDVRIYSRALSAEEIARLYEDTK